MDSLSQASGRWRLSDRVPTRDMEGEVCESAPVVNLPAADWKCLGFPRPTPTRCIHPICNGLLENKQFQVEQSIGVTQQYHQFTINYPSSDQLEPQSSHAQNVGDYHCPFENCRAGERIWFHTKKIVPQSPISFFPPVCRTTLAGEAHLITVHQIRPDVITGSSPLMWGSGKISSTVGAGRGQVLKKRSAADFLKLQNQQGKDIFHCQFDDCKATRTTNNGIRKHINETHK